MSDAELPARWSASTVYPDMWVDPAGDPREAGVHPHAPASSAREPRSRPR